MVQSGIAAMHWQLTRAESRSLQLEDSSDVLGTSQEVAPYPELTRVQFGFQLEALPDLFASMPLAGMTPAEKFTAAFRRHQDIVLTLAKWKQAAFALRLIWNPTAKRTALYVLAAVGGPRASVEISATEIARQLHHLYASHGYPLTALSSQDALDQALQLKETDALFEIRQREELARLVMGDAFVVHPYQAAGTETWLGVLELLARQLVPCTINLHLQPTILAPEEHEFFARAAQFAATLSEQTFDGYVTQFRWTDPIAQSVAELYSDYVGRLHDPFLVVAQVTAPEAHAAQVVAMALASQFDASASEKANIARPSRTETPAQIWAPGSTSERRAAGLTYSNLQLHAWGASLAANAPQRRLAYLADARTASLLFRFPLPLGGGAPGLRTRQPVPQHDPGLGEGVSDADRLPLGHLIDYGTAVVLAQQQLTRHTLVAGTNGSGKTTTCMHVLNQVWQRGIPFLVIEPAKHEYRALLASAWGNQVQVFTLGDESCSPFRLNPLEILPGVRVEAHLAALRACLESALPTFGVLPSLIEDSLQRVYWAHGWSLIDVGEAGGTRVMPTLGEFYHEIIAVADERGYSDRTLQDIRAAAAGRIGSLLKGSKGRMLNCRHSLAAADLLTRPTVLELEALNDGDKSLIMLFLLTLIREYVQLNRPTDRLQHVTLIEEAHRLMTATPHVADREQSGDAAASAVDMLGAAFAELRAAGEGLILAEQLPGKLEQSALKNTNTKIIHQLPGADDRHLLAGTMNLSPEQEDYIAKLTAGQAAFFQTGYERPTLVQIADFRQAARLPLRFPAAEVQTRMQAFFESHPESRYPYPGCQHCERACRLRDRVTQGVYAIGATRVFRESLAAFESLIEQGQPDEAWRALAATCRVLAPLGPAEGEHAAWCAFLHFWAGRVSAATAERFKTAYRQIDRPSRAAT